MANACFELSAPMLYWLLTSSYSPIIVYAAEDTLQSDYTAHRHQFAKDGVVIHKKSYHVNVRDKLLTVIDDDKKTLLTLGGIVRLSPGEVEGTRRMARFHELFGATLYEEFDTLSKADATRGAYHWLAQNLLETFTKAYGTKRTMYHAFDALCDEYPALRFDDRKECAWFRRREAVTLWQAIDRGEIEPA